MHESLIRDRRKTLSSFNDPYVSVKEQKDFFFFLKNHPKTCNFIHFWQWGMAIVANSQVFPSKQLSKEPNVLSVKKIMYPQ